jgi:hypothetical protein
MVCSAPLSLGLGNGMGLDNVSNDHPMFPGDLPALWQYDAMGNVVNKPRSLTAPNIHGGYVSERSTRSNLLI